MTARPLPIGTDMPSAPVDTSEDAGDRAKQFAQSHAVKVLQWLGTMEHGGTQDHASRVLGISRQSIAPRFWQLTRAGMITKTTGKRPTDTGTWCRVYRVTDAGRRYLAR